MLGGESRSTVERGSDSELVRRSTVLWQRSESAAMVVHRQSDPPCSPESWAGLPVGHGYGQRLPRLRAPGHRPGPFPQIDFIPVVEQCTVVRSRVRSSKVEAHCDFAPPLPVPAARRFTAAGSYRRGHRGPAVAVGGPRSLDMQKRLFSTSLGPTQCCPVRGGLRSVAATHRRDWRVAVIAQNLKW